MSAANTDKFRKTSPRKATTLSGSVSSGDTTIACTSLTGWPTDTAVDVVINRVDSNGDIQGAWEGVTAVVSGNNLTNALRGEEGTASAWGAGTVVEMLWSSQTWEDAVDGILVEHAQDGTHTSAVTEFYMPVGGIIMWSGSIVSIPATWALCDGTNGTPDLRDRFIVGAGSTYAVADTGGAATVTLDTTMIPSHTHTQNAHNHTQDAHTHTQNAHTHTQNAHTHTQNAHNHTVWGSATGLTSGGLSIGTLASSTDTANKTSSSTTATNQNTTATNQNTTATNQNTTATNQAATAVNQNTGGGLAHENLPPYYALAYIMKL